MPVRVPAALASLTVATLLAPSAQATPRAEAPAKKTEAPAKKGEAESEADTDSEVPGPTVDADVEELGPVTWMDARADLSVSKSVGFFPQAALLRVGPLSEGDETAWRPYFGGGAIYRPSDDWSLELSAMYAPPSYNITSLGGIFGVEKEFGADWENDKPPVVELGVELALTHFAWENGLGPAGEDLFQWFVEVKPLIRLGAGFEVTPRGMYFVYDKALTTAAGDRLGSVMVLAEVGAFAPPRALGGARAAYHATGWLAPFVEADEILYAYDSGDATELLAGASLKPATFLTFVLGGGALLNRNSGPLIPPEEANTSLPMVISEVTLEL
jgi:hypothetical protein